MFRYTRSCNPHPSTHPPTHPPTHCTHTHAYTHACTHARTHAHTQFDPPRQTLNVHPLVPDTRSPHGAQSPPCLRVCATRARGFVFVRACGARTVKGPDRLEGTVVSGHPSVRAQEACTAPRQRTQCVRTPWLDAARRRNGSHRPRLNAAGRPPVKHHTAAVVRRHAQPRCTPLRFRAMSHRCRRAGWSAARC